MSSVPGLQRLARRCSPDPETGLVEVLQLACEQLQMAVALLGEVHDGVHTVRLAVGADGRRPDLEGSLPAGESLCGHVPGDRSLVVQDLAQHPRLAAKAGPRRTGVRCYAGTSVIAAGGELLGVLGVLGHEAHDRLDERDVAVLEGLAAVVGELLPAFLRPAVRLPAQREPADEGAPERPDLETLTRPLLEALQELSGIASTYLTVVHEADGVQEIRYARNTKDGFALPEQLHVPWSDTLCKRALDEGRSCTTDVPAVWGDSQAAQDLGIVTYVSVPVRLQDGQVWGTLCAADDVAHEQAAQHLPTLALFARLIGGEVERSVVLERERASARLARREADTDLLTGCASRRTVQPWLDRALADCPSEQVVVLTFVDVDRFKQVNDRWGHTTGDSVLATLGARLLSCARPGDLVARLGGDEFLVAATLPRSTALALSTRVRDAGRFVVATEQGPLEVGCSVGVASSDDADDGAALLNVADLDMYRHKRLVRA